jgi:hypothetical protein
MESFYPEKQVVLKIGIAFVYILVYSYLILVAN